MNKFGESVFIAVYGYVVEIRSSHRSALDGIAEDFAFFRSQKRAAPTVIELLDEEPSYSDLPALKATVYTPRNVAYRDGDRTYLDYSGRALAIHDTKAASFRVFTTNSDLAYEIAYLFLLSQCGEWFDSRGLHRVHALAVCVGDCAGLVLLPMGGGKSRLGANLLQVAGIELLSDDSPLIDHRGRVYAFPLRLGLLPGSIEAVPEKEPRRVERMEFGPKMLASYAFFEDRIRSEAEGCVLFLGRRSLGLECSVEKASYRSALWAMTSNCIVGLGLFQGMEFVFQRSAGEIAAKAMVARRRLAASMRLIRRAQVFHLSLGRDGRENARVVLETIDEVAKMRIAASPATGVKTSKLQ